MDIDRGGGEGGFLFVALSYPSIATNSSACGLVRQKKQKTHKKIEEGKGWGHKREGGTLPLFLLEALS